MKANIYLIQRSDSGQPLLFQPRITVELGEIPQVGDTIFLSEESTERIKRKISIHNKVFPHESVPQLNTENIFEIVSRTIPESGLLGEVGINIFIENGRTY